MSITDNVRIVLIETSHPGNIGAVARAMKTMALSRLVLVRPHNFPSAECTARACGADDVLANAQICEQLEEAIQDCHLVIGSSARQRTVAWPELDPRQTAMDLLTGAASGNVALLFGRERTGLSNEELDCCQFVTRIPSNPAFSSLNLAAAVQIFAYELQVAQLAGTITAKDITAARKLAPMLELESMFEHLAVTVKLVGFADPLRSRKLMRRLRRLFYRAQLDRNEINLLRGLFSSTQYLAQRVLDLTKYNADR